MAFKLHYTIEENQINFYVSCGEGSDFKAP